MNCIVANSCLTIIPKRISVAPQISPITVADEPVNWGESISVVCVILKGDLPIDISWALNGEPIGQNYPDINIVATTKRNSIMSIDSINAQHAGEYTCTASNKAGATSQSATLAVNGIPEKKWSYFLISFVIK